MQDKQINLICLSVSGICPWFSVLFLVFFFCFKALFWGYKFDFKTILYKSWMPKLRISMHSIVSTFIIYVSHGWEKLSSSQVILSMR